MTGVSEERQLELEYSAMGDKFRSKAAWSDASSYAVADVSMLRKELAIGYTIAGFLAALVSNHVWNALFLHGHGFWTSLENALVGPLIAVISWVCSIGNVPLAAALWSGGISFGGVIAFIFADLIAMPLILIYRKFYGSKLTLRIVALFYATMAISGLLTEGIFNLFGGVPTHRAIGVAKAHFEWNYTTYLNFVFIAVAIAVWWLAHNRAKYGGGVGYAIDPVCGMQVRSADAPAMTVHDGVMIHFCSDRCKDRFVTNPQRFVGEGATPEGMEPSGPVSVGIGRNPVDHSAKAIDPICGMTVDPATAAAHRQRGGDDVWFCSEGCAATFDEQSTHHHPTS
jgi:YHS domain-containing protein